MPTFVYKTDLTNEAHCKLAELFISEVYPACEVSVDVDDIDRILRVVGEELNSEKCKIWINKLRATGLNIERLL